MTIKEFLETIKDKTINYDYVQQEPNFCNGGFEFYFWEFGVLNNEYNSIWCYYIKHNLQNDEWTIHIDEDGDMQQAYEECLENEEYEMSKKYISDLTQDEINFLEEHCQF